MSINPNFNTTNNLIESGYYFGIIESVSDPSGLMRVKCRILGIHNDNRKLLSTTDLPWSLVGNATNNNGKHTLKSGNFVVCTFLDSDKQQPIVLYSLFSKLKSSNIILNSIQDYQSPGAVFLNSKSNIIPDQIIFDNKIPDEVVAKSQDGANIANPFGQNSDVSIANGANGGVSMFGDIEREIVSLGNIFKYVVLYDTDDIILSEDIDSEIGFIPLNRINGLPKSGIIQIDTEIITYAGLADTGISGQILRGSPDRGSIIPTKKSPHTKGTSVRWIYPITKNDRSPLFYSRLTGQAIDFGKEIKKRMSVISGYITWLLSRVSSQITQFLSQLISNITLMLKSPIALVGKLIVDALLLVLSQVLCAFDKSTVDSLVDQIEKTITKEIENLIKIFYENGQSVINFIENCTNKIFDSILQFSSIIQSIGNLITNVTNLFPGITNVNIIKGNDFNNISLEDITKSAPIIANLLNFLGLGCKTQVGENIKFYSDNQGTNDCTTNSYYPNAIQCSPNPDIIELLNGLWRPLPQFITTYDFGGGLKIEYDNTPSTERSLITSPGGTYTEVFADGTSKTVITKDNYQLILNDDYIEVKGNCAWKIDGDFALKVSGNMDLEVGKQLRTSVGGSSQITYGGSHTTNYFGDSTLNAANKLNITGSQVGIAASGTIELAGGVLNAINSEINLSSTGSLSLMSLYGNHITALSYKEIHSGSVDKLVAGTEKKINLGSYTGDVIGNEVKNYMGTKTANILGTNTLTNSGLYSINSNIKIDNTIGLNQTNSQLSINNSNLKIDTITGANLNYAKGISLRKTEGGINFDG